MNMKTETLFSNTETSNSKQIAVLKKNFPQCFDSNGNFIQDKLLEIVNSENVDISKETYSLNWLGKSYARLLTNLPPKTLLSEDKAHNALAPHNSSQNLLIKGDNLEVLKHLVNAYPEKVKLIYIDPPYNTGKDSFTYQDDRNFKPEQLSELANISLNEANRVLEFTTKGSNNHSAWMTFIYPRLYIAREFLKEDGAIFISIDDNEIAQLKVLCDEVFGPQNFLGNIVWNNVTDNNPTNIATEHEYILAYAKDKSSVDSVWKSTLSDIKDKLLQVGQELIEKYKDQEELQAAYTEWFKENKFQLGALDRYKYIDKGGIYTGSQSVHNPGKDGYKYDVIHPTTGKPCKLPLMGYRFKESTMKSLVENDKIIFGKDHNKIIELKLYAHEYEEKFSSVMQMDGRLGANQLRDLFPELKKVFTNPKPTQLIEKIISYVCQGDELILDFFAGSGTTAHAVMNLNSVEGTNYKFINIQLPETMPPKFGTDYKTVFDLTKERLIRASKETNQGFKVFEIVEDFRIKDEAELSLSNLTFFDDVVLTNDQYHSLLTTWAVYDGSTLTTPIKDINLSGYTAHLCDRRLYLIAPNFNSESIRALLNLLDTDNSFSPNKVVFYGNNFESKIQMELNEALKSYANKKSLELDLVVRN